MAEGGSKKDECPICKEKFTKPRLLPCSHTFCEGCLRQLTTNCRYAFDCPMCRERIKVPKGGVAKFKLNNYVNDSAVCEKQYYCKTHKEEINFYCHDCSVAICGCCQKIDHSNHGTVELKDTDVEFRTELSDLCDELVYKIPLLQAHSRLYETKRIGITKSQKVACSNVDKKVQIICEEVKNIGKKVKRQVKSFCDTERTQLQNLADDMNSLIDNLQSVLTSSREVLAGSSTKALVDNVSVIKRYTHQTDLKPIEVRHPHFSIENEIEIESLKQSVGELNIKREGTMSACFDLKDMLDEKDSQLQSDCFRIGDITWCTCVKHDKCESYLGVWLQLKDAKDEIIKADRTIKLIHQDDDKKSISSTKRGDVYKSSGTAWGFNHFIPWDTLKDPKNNFLNNNCFTIQTTVEIIE